MNTSTFHRYSPLLLVSLFACPRGEQGDASTFDGSSGDDFGDEQDTESEDDTETSTSENDTETSTSEDDTGGPECGNGVLEPGEECDAGPANADSGACTSACELAVCGDGLVHAGVEACDDQNTDNSDDCTTDCQAPACDDRLLSGDETDVDCGGSCEPCELGESCEAGSDCTTLTCVVSKSSRLSPVAWELTRKRHSSIVVTFSS